MLELRTLLNKNYFTKKDGTVVVDLVRRAVSFLGVRMNSGKPFIVTEETAMRADLISNYFYQNSSYADLLLKYNGFSNPFSINVGDIIRIPDSENLLKYGGDQTVRTSALSSTRKKKSNFVLSEKSRKDQKRILYLLQKASSIEPNLNKLMALVNSGNAELSNIGSQLSTILQGGNYTGLGPLQSAYQGDNALPVPPNVALENGIKLANGKIVFGNDVTSVKKEDCAEPISRAKLKESLVKNKLE